MTTPAIEVRGLRKPYGTTVVLDGVDLSVAPGTVTALLGPNGAGKTTTVHILSTLLKSDEGTAFVNGCDVARDPDGVRAVIGLTGQFSAVDTLLTGEENLLLMARLRHLGSKRSATRAAELLEQFDLVEAARTPLATYSGGMRRRLDLAMTLVATPSVIFLDEPTTGLDPRSCALLERGVCDRLVHRDRGHRVRLVEDELRAQVGALTPAQSRTLRAGASSSRPPASAVA